MPRQAGSGDVGSNWLDAEWNEHHDPVLGFHNKLVYW